MFGSYYVIPISSWSFWLACLSPSRGWSSWHLCDRSTTKKSKRYKKVFFLSAFVIPQVESRNSPCMHTNKSRPNTNNSVHRFWFILFSMRHDEQTQSNALGSGMCIWTMDIRWSNCTGDRNDDWRHTSIVCSCTLALCVHCNFLIDVHFINRMGYIC